MKKVIFALVCLNILNILDGITTYIALHGPFYETNKFAVGIFSSFGLLLGNILKIGIILFFSICIFYFLKWINTSVNKFPFWVKATNNVYFLVSLALSFNFFTAVIQNTHNLVVHYA